MKRLVDLVIVIPSLILLSPLLLAVSLCIKFASPGPILFRQRRVGRDGRVFQIYKFRTMVTGAATSGPQVTASDDPRITRLGRWLRRSKLDELPQLLNVVMGDMSLVGPRPQVPRFVQHYPMDVREIVFSVRPGLTDPATIFYRNEERLLVSAKDPERSYLDSILPHKLDMYVGYIQRQTLVSDLVVLLRTLACLLRPSSFATAQRQSVDRITLPRAEPTTNDLTLPTMATGEIVSGPDWSSSDMADARPDEMACATL